MRRASRERESGRSAKPPEGGRLLFVYAADGGFVRTLFDAAHKALSPETYPCSLCRLTHGLLGERRRWRRFVGSLPLPATFLHRDEFRRLHPEIDAALPALFIEKAAGLTPLLDGSALGRCRTLDDLEAAVASAVERALGLSTD